MSEPTTVRPPEEIDVSTAASLDEALQRCDPEGFTVVELEHVRLCDSSGVRVLVLHALRHADAGGTLRVTEPQPIVRRVFGIVGVSELLGVSDGAAPGD
jgi:anti-anti-sigma factor